MCMVMVVVWLQEQELTQSLIDNFREGFIGILGSLSVQSQGLPRWLSGRESACQCKTCKTHEFDF